MAARSCAAGWMILPQPRPIWMRSRAPTRPPGRMSGKLPCCTEEALERLTRASVAVAHTTRIRRRFARHDRAQPDGAQPVELLAPVAVVQGQRVLGVRTVARPLDGVVIGRTLERQHDGRLAVGRGARLNVSTAGDERVALIVTDHLWAKIGSRGGVRAMRREPVGRAAHEAARRSILV